MVRKFRHHMEEKLCWVLTSALKRRIIPELFLVIELTEASLSERENHLSCH